MLPFLFVLIQICRQLNVATFIYFGLFDWIKEKCDILVSDGGDILLKNN